MGATGWKQALFESMRELITGGATLAGNPEGTITGMAGALGRALCAPWMLQKSMTSDACRLRPGWV